MEPPTGTVTFLFTDIAGSTRLWEEHPEAMRGAVARHDELLTEAIASHGGTVFKIVGDSLCAAFERATDALAAALTGQRLLQAEGWPEATPLQVRVALYTGEAEARGGDYFGQPLNRCARILAAGHGGQVLLSQSAAELVRDLLPAGAELQALGEHRLRDLARPEALFQLVHPGLPSEFPPLRSLQAFAHNLPIQLTSLVGREDELAEVRRLLGTTRLLTLTGTGGAGKTRLALQVAADLLDAYADGVWFVELATLTDASLVPQAALSALGLREEPGRALVGTLVDSLCPKRLLLILDNCEHVVDACAGLAEQLLRGCPRASVLATSREVLRAEGEVVWRVPSLPAPTPEARHAERLSALTQYAAVRLFIDRAVAAKAGFGVTNENAPAVAEICWRLDGIPLAVELAAARVNVLSPEQIRERLDDRFRLLTGGRRTALPRQRTLLAAVEWSYGLLPQKERVLFGRLAVFTGGFSLDAGAAVCADADIAEPEFVDLLTELAVKSLVVVEEVADGPRCRLLETLRAYAAERLAETGQEEALRARHARCFSERVREAKAHLRGPEQHRWLCRLEGDHDNLRAALSWCVKHAPDTGLQLANDLVRFWEVRGYWREGRAWLDQYIAVGDVAGGQGRAAAMIAAGGIARLQGDSEDARTLLEGGLALSRSCGWQAGVASALNNLGNVLTQEGRFASAQAEYEESLRIREELGDRAATGTTLHNLARVLQEQGEYARARGFYERSMAISRDIGDSHLLSMSLGNLGNCYHAEGQYPAARRTQEEVLGLARRLGDRASLAYSLHNLALLAHEQGDYETASGHYAECLAIQQELGNTAGVAVTLNNLANMALEQGDLETAWTLHERCLELQRKLGNPGLAGRTLANLGNVARARGAYGDALDLAREGLAACVAADDRPGAAAAGAALGDAALAAGDHARAGKALSEALLLAFELAQRLSVASCLESLARLAHAQAEPVKAARLLGVADALREEMGTPRPPAERREIGTLTDALQQTTGDDAFRAAWDAGRAMALEEAVGYALEEGGDG
jgi:predicted ATPase/class 3 adenylate cyclase